MRKEIFSTGIDEKIDLKNATFFTEEFFAKMENQLKRGFLFKCTFDSKTPLSSIKKTIDEKELTDMLYKLDNKYSIFESVDTGLSTKQKSNYLKNEIYPNTSTDLELFQSMQKNIPNVTDKDIVKEFTDKGFTHYFTDEYPKQIYILNSQEIKLERFSPFYEKEKTYGYFSTPFSVTNEDQSKDFYESIQVYKTIDEAIDKSVSLSNNQRYINDLHFKKGIGLSNTDITITDSQLEEIISGIDLEKIKPQYTEIEDFKASIIKKTAIAYSDRHVIANLNQTLGEELKDSLYKELDKQGFTHYQNENESIQLINSELNVLSNKVHQFDTHDSDIDVYVAYNPFEEGNVPQHKSAYFEPEYLNNELKEHNSQSEHVKGYFLYKNPTQETLEKENVQALYDRHRTETDGFTSKDLEFRNNHYSKHVLNKLNEYLVPDPDNTNQNSIKKTFKNKTIKLSILNLTEQEDTQELLSFELEDLRSNQKYELSTKDCNKDSQSISTFNDKLNSIIKVVDLGFDPNIIFSEKDYSKKYEKIFTLEENLKEELALETNSKRPSKGIEMDF